MENFDDYFKTLGEINHVERELKCCELKENFEYTNKGETICKICNNTISNIIDTPEWKNYKDSNNNTINELSLIIIVSYTLPRMKIVTIITLLKYH